eukprot:10231381-Alexandrium_andersonii.AAC.1
MSASLVGSEMCIRDRKDWDRDGRPRPGLHGNEEPAHEVHGDPDREAAVSYTHLTLPTICSV